MPLLEVARFAARLTPHRWALALGRWGGGVAWRFSGKSRKIAERQILRTGIAPDQAEARLLGRRVFEELGMNSMEWLHSFAWTDDQVRQLVQAEGLDIARQALAQGKGIVFVSAHLGNWELIVRSFRAHTGQIPAIVMAEQRSEALNRWLARLRESAGSHILFASDSAIGMLRRLRRGGLLALLADQDSTRGRGIFVKFFGRPAYSPVGPAHLGRRTGAPLIPIIITRRRDDPRSHCLRFGPFIMANPQLEEEKDIRRMTQEYTDFFEQQIRENPAQWAWVHNRWKHRPGQKIRIRSAGGGQKKVKL